MGKKFTFFLVIILSFGTVFADFAETGNSQVEGVYMPKYSNDDGDYSDYDRLLNMYEDLLLKYNRLQNDYSSLRKAYFSSEEEVGDNFLNNNSYDLDVGDDNPRYNFVAGDKVTCEETVSKRFPGMRGECTIGGGCGFSCGKPGNGCVSANPNLYGLCTDGSDLISVSNSSVCNIESVDVNTIPAFAKPGDVFAIKGINYSKECDNGDRFKLSFYPNNKDYELSGYLNYPQNVLELKVPEKSPTGIDEKISYHYYVDGVNSGAVTTVDYSVNSQNSECSARIYWGVPDGSVFNESSRIPITISSSGCVGESLRVNIFEHDLIGSDIVDEIDVDITSSIQSEYWIARYVDDGIGNTAEYILRGEPIYSKDMDIVVNGDEVLVDKGPCKILEVNANSLPSVAEPGYSFAIKGIEYSRNCGEGDSFILEFLPNNEMRNLSYELRYPTQSFELRVPVENPLNSGNIVSYYYYVDGVDTGIRTKVSYPAPSCNIEWSDNSAYVGEQVEVKWTSENAEWAKYKCTGVIQNENFVDMDPNDVTEGSLELAFEDSGYELCVLRVYDAQGNLGRCYSKTLNIHNR